MSEARKPMYGLIIGGEWDALDENIDEIMERAKMWTMERINDFHRHALPLQVNPTIAREMDVYVYRLADENRVEIPLQAWFDKYYQEMKQDEIDDKEREWKCYLELAEKFKERIAKENV